MKTENNHLRSVLNLPFLILNCLLYFQSISQPVFGQGDMGARQSFAQAESEYQIGRIDNAITIVNANVSHYDGTLKSVSHYDGTLKSGAYRLLALCYLAQDNIEEANRYVDLLLQEDPYYSITVNDPERFAELIRNKKEGKTTLVTASQQAETLEEAPVPVTLITEEMIEALGPGRNLKDVLATYVPGITIVETTNMDNISMHGIYTSGQEKILIMLNGHRLNTRSTNNATPDFSISLAKIKQIEVLRGPASSLYGNVALTAVVNIITKNGSDTNGVEATYGMGTYGTYQADLLIGKHFMNMDFFAWGSFYQAEGQKIFMAASQAQNSFAQDGNIIINGYNGKPSYDYGFTYKWGDFSAMFNQRYGKKVAPRSLIANSAYNYKRYRKIENTRPGYGTNSTHAELGYNKTWESLSLDINLYADLYTLQDYTAAADSMLNNKFQENGQIQTDENGNPIWEIQKGVFQIINWQESTFGGIAKIGYNYKSSFGKGYLLAGSQFERFNLQDSYSILGKDFEEVLMFQSASNSFFKTGGENSLSFFIQDKHTFPSNFILNLGLRYDYKKRKDSKIHAFSPRISVIYTANDIWNLKLSYSKSFVDAPYFYRQNTSNTYRGAENLKPEYMDAIQLNIMANSPKSGVSYDFNLYYNKLRDLIYNSNNKDINSTKYQNAGKLNIIGIENSIIYKLHNFIGHINCSYQYLLSGENYFSKGHHIYNIPNFMLNAILSWNAFSLSEHHFWLHGHLRGISYTKFSLSNSNIEGKESGYTVFNCGVEYKYKNITISTFCYNLFNKNYRIGGTVSVPTYQQNGRSFIASLSYHFN